MVGKAAAFDHAKKKHRYLCFALHYKAVPFLFTTEINFEGCCGAVARVADSGEKKRKRGMRCEYKIGSADSTTDKNQ